MFKAAAMLVPGAAAVLPHIPCALNLLGVAAGSAGIASLGISPPVAAVAAVSLTAAWRLTLGRKASRLAKAVTYASTAAMLALSGYQSLKQAEAAMPANCPMHHHTQP
jgi:hypothetical protein